MRRKSLLAACRSSGSLCRQSRRLLPAAQQLQVLLLVGVVCPRAPVLPLLVVLLVLVVLLSV
jgi:hypothetical protein